MALKNPPIAIAGATGFVGTHLLNALRKQGKRTRALVRSKKECLADEVIVGDPSDKEAINEFLSKADVLVNLIGGYHPPLKLQLESNVLTLNNLCEGAARQKVKKIIHVSSSAIYGSKQESLFQEDDRPMPDTQYGLAKLMGESVAAYFNRNFSLPFIILRPPNIYGPGSKDGVIHHFLRSIQEKGKIVIFGEGEERRDYFYVADMVEVIMKMMDYEANYEVFNVGSGELFSLKEVATLFGKALNKKIPIVYKERKTKTSALIASDTTKVQNRLAWQPQYTLEKGLKKIIEEV